jgi:hypothetical protein
LASIKKFGYDEEDVVFNCLVDIALTISVIWTICGLAAAPEEAMETEPV